VEAVLQAADSHAFRTSTHESAIDLEPRRIAKGLQAGGGIIEFHASQCRPPTVSVNGLSRTFEILARALLDGVSGLVPPLAGIYDLHHRKHDRHFDQPPDAGGQRGAG